MRRFEASCPSCDPVWTNEMTSSWRDCCSRIFSPLYKMSSAPMETSLKFLLKPFNVGSFCGAWPSAMKWRRRFICLSLS